MVVNSRFGELSTAETQDIQYGNDVLESSQRPRGSQLKGASHCSTHDVSKSKYICSLLIDVIALKTALRCSSAIMCHS